MAGSDTRQRKGGVFVRLTPDEEAAVNEKADRAGMAKAAFMRAAALGSPGPRAQRRPPADHEALRRILGQLGRIGNNINQIAHAMNTGQQAQIPELREALTAYLETRNAIFAALGMKREGDDHQRRQ